MTRREFSSGTRRAALKRAGGKCEARGRMYGLEPGQVCGASLAYGLEFDHIILDANSKDASLDNCAVCCIKCHRTKSAKHDTPCAAKTVRQQDKNIGGIGRRKSSRPFPGGRGSKYRRKMSGEVVLRDARRGE